MQHNNEDQFRSLRTKNIKIWRKNIISFHKKKENKNAGNNFHMKWNFFKNCLPGIMHLLELKKLQEAESILISWISIELEFFFLIALG